MAQVFDIVVENVVLNAKSTILEEAAGTQAGQRYVYIVEAAGDTIKKVKDFIVKNKGKLAALAALGALGGAGYVAYKQGALENVARKFGEKAIEFADQEHQIKINNLTNDIKNEAIDLKNKLKEYTNLGGSYLNLFKAFSNSK